ncbi:MAG: TetR/AcrR family transcriptional regulator [Glaciihabitans sp.]|jgi:AcrR family transcriptional regulator|nr:TetR/AcrR family transcriptional regulator [Glaciihabitans sp.]
MSIAEAPGLRERKRIATRKAIQRAVLELALERGLERVTIEEISRVADISPRTFFNYFVSKEAAIVGDSPDFIDGEALQHFVDGGPNGDLIRDLGYLLADAAERASEDRDTQIMRKELHSKYPHLFALRMAGMRVFEDELSAVVARRLLREDAAYAKDQATLASRSRLVTLVAMGALRHAWTCWADSANKSGEPLAGRMRDTFDQLESVFVKSRQS